MSKLLERHQMTSLERDGAKGSGAQETLGEPSLQEKVEAMKRRYAFNRSDSSNRLTLHEAGLELLTLGIDSVGAALQLGVKFNTVIYLRGELSLKEFVAKALAATQAEEESVPTPMRGA